MKSIKGVLVPTDFSPNAWQAVLTGIKLAKIGGAPVHLIHIAPNKSAIDYLKDLDTKLKNIAENLSTIYSVAVESIIKEGDPRTEIENSIENLDVDMVVMGLNGTGGNEIGSLTGYVMHHLNCPVMVVPAIDKESALIE